MQIPVRPEADGEVIKLSILGTPLTKVFAGIISGGAVFQKWRHTRSFKRA